MTDHPHAETTADHPRDVPADVPADREDDVERSVAAADVANGEPSATADDVAAHPTGEEQVPRNRTADPPA